MNKWEIVFTPEGDTDLTNLENDPSKKRILKDVRKALAYMETNLRHPSLNTHEYHSVSGPKGEKIFESYAQQNTPGAYRIFWYYGPDQGIISVIAITPHP